VRCVAYIILSLLLSVFVGCTGSSVYHETSIKKPHTDIDLSDETTVTVALNDHFLKWVGTPYRDGGMGRSGIDCSGFVQHTYSSVFGIALPRSTRHQVRSGRKIARLELKPADLVFFKTALFGRHVGVYNGGGQFIHVSSKRGVSMSYLNEGYWNDHFWQARRILE
jgi:cell wall-associated NlpC family hydrolase